MKDSCGNPCIYKTRLSISWNDRNWIYNSSGYHITNNINVKSTKSLEGCQEVTTFMTTPLWAIPDTIRFSQGLCPTLSHIQLFTTKNVILEAIFLFKYIPRPNQSGSYIRLSEVEANRWKIKVDIRILTEKQVPYISRI